MVNQTQTTQIQKKHTLEKLVDALGNRFNEEKLHTAMLLSYAQTVYEVTRKECVSSPQYRVSYDETNNIVSVQKTEGNSMVPEKNALDINALDTILISNLRDIPILFEGETGVGKTFLSQKYFKAILPKESYVALRLSGNTFLNNIFQPFLEGSIVNGMPVTNIKKDAVNNVAGLFVDEINRGDPQSVLQLLDNELYNAGQFVKLGIKIPSFELNKKGKISYTGKRKKLEIITAQNPSSNSDAKYTSTIELDAAVDNRLLKIYFGNAAPSAGSCLWLGDRPDQPHKLFIQSLKERVSKYLNLKPKQKQDAFNNFESDWLSTYAWISEASRTDKSILYSAIELSDFMTAVFSNDLTNYYQYEKTVVNDWSKKLGKNVNITYDQPETEQIKQIHEITKTFKVPIIFRDIVQMKKLADVLSTLKNIKDALNTNDPVKSYLQGEKYISVREVAGAAALLAINKQVPDSPSPTNEVNATLNEYVNLAQKYMKDEGYIGSKFQLNDPNASIKKIAVHKALRDTLLNAKGSDYLIDQVCGQVDKLTNYITTSESLRNILIVRSAGDLMTFAGFIDQYKDKIKPVLSKYSGELKKASTPRKKVKVINQARHEIGDVFYDLRKENGMVMPDIYMHRVQRTLGV